MKVKGVLKFLFGAIFAIACITMMVVVSLGLAGVYVPPLWGFLGILGVIIVTGMMHALCYDI